MVPLEHFLVVSALLFSIGVYGVLARRNAITILMSVELMLNAVTLNFVAFASYGDPERFTGVIFASGGMLRVGAVGLAITLIFAVFATWRGRRQGALAAS